MPNLVSLPLTIAVTWCVHIDRHINRQPDKQKYRQTDRPTDKKTDRHGLIDSASDTDYEYWEK